MTPSQLEAVLALIDQYERELSLSTSVAETLFTKRNYLANARYHARHSDAANLELYLIAFGVPIDELTAVFTLIGL